MIKIHWTEILFWVTIVCAAWVGWELGKFFPWAVFS